MPPSLLATCAIRFLEDLPKDARTNLDTKKLAYALKHRYSKQEISIPVEILSALSLFAIMDMDHHLLSDVQSCGPQVTSSPGAAQEFLSRQPSKNIDEKQVAAVLLFMVLTPLRQQYVPALFTSAVHDPLDAGFWQTVIQEFDIKELEISKDQFITLFNALLPIAQENPHFDIQQLWGGRWRNPQTQLSFLRAFLSCSPSELDATTIPGLRQAYDPPESSDGPRDVAEYAEQAQRDPIISLDAVIAVFDLLVRPDELPTEGEQWHVAGVVGTKEAFFLCSSVGIQKPWGKGQMSIMKQLLGMFLSGGRPDSAYVLHTLWKQDKQWVAMILIETHLEDPLELTMILDRAREYDWLDDLLTLMKGFGLDLAALAHRKGFVDLNQWAEDKLAQDPDAVVDCISKFLVLKAQDELRTARDEQPGPRTVSLAIKTVYDMLEILQDHMADRSELKALQRQCIQAYPRLIIYGESFTQTVDVDCKESNRLPRAADQEMQELYKRMYNRELKVEDILEYLQQCKGSELPSKLDIFACMIHGLYDEFACFGEYPLAPLATTAVLFGGIISFELITGLSLRVGQEMILDAVRDYPPEASMYKFGLQALLNILQRLKEPAWADYCSKIVQLPGLRGTEPFRLASEVLTENGLQVGMDEPGVNGMADGLPNGDIDEFLSADTTPHFRSVNAESASASDEPDEDTQEKVVFFFNNVSEQNLQSRLAQLQEALEDIHPQWFANFLVEGRAKVEPNYQPLYLDILVLLGNKALWNEVLRETYVSVKEMLNAESTMQSASERKNLKNLSIWLGSLTIARDKPIKHRNISFLELLIEGFETQRLNLIIPFTCNVLVQGTKSVVFKPPNPWVVEIMATLLELYFHFDIKLNHKFEIEVLIKEFGLAMNSIDPSDTIRNRPVHDETLSNAVVPDGPEGFEDISLSINRTVRNPRFEIDSITSALPDLESVLVYPPATGSSANQAKLRDIVQKAIKGAILEIIAPVVERSVTIATIATGALVHKDFAREPDEDRVRKAAQKMVRQLSGSLALVTCKEPLKMSMTNNIRMAQAESPEQAFPEGSILMCVNDNLEIACNVVEKQAEERSIPEIEAHIEAEIASRRQHRLTNPNESFQDPAFSHWSTFISEPYKQSFNGLNPEQLGIYLEFARQSRGPASHAQTSSADSGRQLPDVLQDAFASLPNVCTPATELAMPHQSQQQQQHQQTGRMLPPPIHNSIPSNQVNGYLNLGAIQDRVHELLGEISRLIKENPNTSMDDVQGDVPALVEILNQAWELIASSPDSIAMNCAEDICKAVFGEPMIRLEVEVFVHLLARLCQVYPSIRKEVAVWATSQSEMKLLNLDVTVPLVKAEIISLKQADASLTSLLYDRIEGAVDFLSDIMDALLLNDHPVALRADFARSLGALSQWLAENPDYESAKDLVQRLKDWGVGELGESTPDTRGLVKKHQLQYVFAEWTAICSSYSKNPTDQVFATFIFQLHQRQVVNSTEDMAVFLRVCIDEALETYALTIMDRDGTSNQSFFKVDWLARLIVLLVKNQGEQNGSVRLNKAAYMDSILAAITLIINNHQVMEGDRFNQRVFFRLLSSILCDWHDFGRESYAQDRDMLLVYARNFESLSPRLFPAFTYSWLMLISHRLFMPSLLKLSNDEVGRQRTPCVIPRFHHTNLMKGWEPFAKIMEAAMSYICQFLKPNAVSPLAIDLYRGILRLILVLHHDFPEFLAENHFRLCNSIPHHCTQLHNLVLSAYPSSFPELPNPFVTGLKVDRLEEMRKEPRIVGDYTSPLVRANIKDIVDASLRSNSIPGDELARLTNAAYVSTGRGLVVNSTLLHALVLHIGQSAITSAGQKGGQAFTGNSPQASLLTKLVKELHPEARYYFLSAMAHQLRYPNSHTHYFSYALLHLFGTDLADQEESDVRQQITRVLLERLHVIKPHPWGLVITMLELIKNQDYNFFQLPFIKASLPVSEHLYISRTFANVTTDPSHV